MWQILDCVLEEFLLNNKCGDYMDKISALAEFRREWKGASRFQELG